jgi:plastocyanin
LRAAVCHSPFVPIATDRSPFTTPPHYTDVVSLNWFTMGRRSPNIYGITKYGAFGAYLGSNPGAPSPTVYQISFREGGPVGGGSLADCWPGPSVIAVADAANGAGRMPMGWFAGSGCGAPEQLVSINSPGGSETFGQQIDVNSGSAVSASALASALTSGGKYIAYFVNSSTLYAVDVSNPAFNVNATPLQAFTTVSDWAGANRLVTLGDATADRYLAGVFFAKGGGTIKFASIAANGDLTPLAGGAALSSGAITGGSAQQVAAYRTATGYLVFVVVSGGIDVFSFDGANVSRLGTIANGANKYQYLTVPYGASTPVVLAEKSGPPDVDVIAGGFLAGQVGSPTVMATIPAAAKDSLEGLGAYIDPSAPANLYVYRVVIDPGFVMQTDTFDASCITSPPTPNPTAAFTLTNKSAQTRTDKTSYVGDSFSFADASKAGTGGAISSWYVWSNYNTSTSTKGNADVQSASAPSLSSIVLPCSNGIVSSQCSYNPASITGTSVSEKFGEQVSAGALDSGVAANTVSLNVPVTRVAAQGSNGSVKILTGGAIDASASDGSPASFAWTFSDAGSGPLTTSCGAAVCVPPSTAAHYTVAAQYAGGYQAAAVSGAVVFTDVGGTISVPPTLYSTQNAATATFALQKGSNVTITGVTFKYDNGAPTAIAPVPPLTGSVQIAVPALTTGQSHTVTFVVTYTGGSLGTSVSFPATFLYSAIQYSPKAWLSKQTSLTSTDTCSTNVFAGANTLCNGSSGAFYLGDQGDFGKPGFPATWDFGDGTPNDTTHNTNDFVSHTFAPGTFTVKLTVGGVTVSQLVTVNSVAGLSASIGGPTSIKTGQSGTWTASASGGQPIYTFSWTSSDGGSGSGATFTHTFNTAGNVTIHLTVHDSASGTATPSRTVSVTTSGGGGGCPPNCPTTNQIVISGAASADAGSPATWTAGVTGVASSSLFIDWKINGTSVEATTSTTLTYTFTASGSYTLTAAGSKIVGGSIIPLTAATKTIAVDVVSCDPNCPPIATFKVTGATFNQFGGSYSAKAGDVVAFSADDAGSDTQFAWDFGDTTAGTGRTIAHAYSQAGTFNARLTATNPYGHATSDAKKFAITGQSFSALIVPGAGHLTSADPTGAYATELSLFNNSLNTITVALDFETSNAGSVDPTKLSFPTSGPGFITLAPNQGWTSSDVTNGLLLQDGLGTLFIKYSGPAPSALARIYFSANAGAPTYGTYLPVYPINAAGASPLAVSASPETQNVVGLQFNDDYRGGLTVISASPTGGLYDVKLFKDTGEQVGSTLSGTILGYQQVKLKSSDFDFVNHLEINDPEHIYYATVAPSAGSTAPAIAIGTVTDNRTRDSLLLTDDGRRPTAGPGGNTSFFLAGVGRTSSGAKTDLYVLNTSLTELSVNFVFHYVDGAGDKHTAQIPEQLNILGGQALEIPDVITSIFPAVTSDAIGDLRVDYQPPEDGGRLVIEGRNYTDTGAGTYGMQLPPYVASDGLLPGSSSRVVLTGLHNDFTEGSTTDFDYVSLFGFVALGDGPVTVHAAAYDQGDGTNFWSGDFTLNSSAYGHFLYIPTTGQYAAPQFTGHAAFNMVVSVTGGDGSTPAAAFATVKDTRSRDLVFIPGKSPSN